MKPELIGRRNERELLEGLRRRDWTVVQDASLDRWQKTDAMISGNGHVQFPKPVALQVTWRLNNLEKIHKFFGQHQARLISRVAMPLFVQIGMDVPMATALNAVDELLSDPLLEHHGELVHTVRTDGSVQAVHWKRVSGVDTRYGLPPDKETSTVRIERRTDVLREVFGATPIQIASVLGVCESASVDQAICLRVAQRFIEAFGVKTDRAMDPATLVGRKATKIMAARLCVKLEFDPDNLAFLGTDLRIVFMALESLWPVLSRQALQSFFVRYMEPAYHKVMAARPQSGVREP